MEMLLDVFVDDRSIMITDEAIIASLVARLISEFYKRFSD